MSATSILDYNQITEQTSQSGDTPPSGGGSMIWQWRCDPNLAWDPANSFFYMDLEVHNRAAGQTAGDVPTGDYLPDIKDFWPFFPLRAFSSIEHSIDGVTLFNSSQPWIDKFIQERYLHDTSVSNLTNFEALLVARCIDDGDRKHNLFCLGSYGMIDQSNINEWILEYLCRDRTKESAIQPTCLNTVLFQPPSDFWTKHQRVSGGNQQVSLTLRPPNSVTSWGEYMATPCCGATSATLGAALGYHLNESSSVSAYDVVNSNGVKRVPYALNRPFENFSTAWPHVNAPSTIDSINYINEHNSAYNMKTTSNVKAYPDDTVSDPQVLYSDGTNKMLSSYANEGTTGFDAATVFASNNSSLYVNIKTIRLLRRSVRFSTEETIGIQEFNTSSTQIFSGTPSTSGISQNFLLPSSTFGIVFYWRYSSDSQFAPLSSMPYISPGPSADGQSPPVIARPSLGLKKFYFTYGGVTYPQQHYTSISRVSNSSSAVDGIKMQAISHMLQGVMNTDQDRFSVNPSSKSMLTSLDGEMFFFPVAKHANSDNSDLQVYWEGTPTISWQLPYYSYSTAETLSKTASISATLCFHAIYDSQVLLSYNQANMLEKTTVTEWK